MRPAVKLNAHSTTIRETRKLPNRVTFWANLPEPVCSRFEYDPTPQPTPGEYLIVIITAFLFLGGLAWAVFHNTL